MTAPFGQCLIHHYVFAPAVLDEKDQVGQTVEQRFARERLRQL
jgi:hypothetical protein